MRVLLRSYDLDDPGESAARLRRLGTALMAAGHEVHATSRAWELDDVRAWSPDVIVAQQWATLEADTWARALRRPLVMLVHGEGQYEAMMPVCDLVAFADPSVRAATADALGQTPAVLLDDVDAVVESIVAVGSAGRRRPTLALCMTVCNEAATLAAAVSSVADIVDEIIIGVDHRSSDETLAIARRLATDCFEYDESSPPDFPRMRNRALMHARTDWALVLDGHEWIEGAEHIRRAIESTTAWSLEVLTLFEPDEHRVPGLSFLFPRIHRRHVRFAGAAAHEELTTPIDRREVHREIRVWHERRPGLAAEQRGAEKRGPELAILRAAWVERGDRRALFYLANGLRECGRHDDAIAAYEEYLRSPNFAEERWQALLYLGRCHAARGDHSHARRVLEQAVVEAPHRAESIVALGYALLAGGQPAFAAAWFRMAAALPEPTDCRLFVEVPVYRWGAWHGLALALHSLGDVPNALSAERRALRGGAGVWAENNVAAWSDAPAHRSQDATTIPDEELVA